MKGPGGPNTPELKKTPLTVDFVHLSVTRGVFPLLLESLDGPQTVHSEGWKAMIYSLQKPAGRQPGLDQIRQRKMDKLVSQEATYCTVPTENQQKISRNADLVYLESQTDTVSLVYWILFSTLHLTGKYKGLFSAGYRKFNSALYITIL